MRNPDRLPDNWNRLMAIHARYPDWRMSQILINLFNELDFDPFYMEDDEFLQKLEEIADSWKRTD